MDRTVVRLDLPARYDLAKTMLPAGMGVRDPSLRVSDRQATLAFHTAEGAATVDAELRGQQLMVSCYGPGRHWIEPRIPALFGSHDSPDDFRPQGKVAELVAQSPGVHLPRLPVVFQRLVQIVLQQLVVWGDALRGWIRIVRKFGCDAPGPGGLRLGPSAQQLARLGYYELMDCQVMPRQAKLIPRLAKECERIERLAESGSESLARFLLSIRGVGDWTVAHLLGTSLGCADAVMTGDYGLPHTVAWFLAQKERSDDDEMLELLEPYRGHRFRVINLLMQGGITAPRRGPKMRSNRWRFTTR